MRCSKSGLWTRQLIRFEQKTSFPSTWLICALSLHTHTSWATVDLARWRTLRTSKHLTFLTLSAMIFLWFSLIQCELSSFVSMVLEAQYVECTAVLRDAFKPNKGLWIFNHGAAVWLSALQTVVTYQYICHLIYPPSRIIENISALRFFQLFTIQPLVLLWFTDLFKTWCSKMVSHCLYSC